MTLKARRVRLTRAARRDLKSLAAYIADKNDARAAARFVSELASKLFEIASKGLTGSSRAFLPPHVKTFPYKGRCFYFTVDDEALTVLRVLGSAQDVADQSFDEIDD